MATLFRTHRLSHVAVNLSRSSPRCSSTSVTVTQRRGIGLSVGAIDNQKESIKGINSSGIGSIEAVGDFSPHHQEIADPVIRILANGLGSIMHVQMPPKSYVFTQQGTITGHSVSVATSSSLLGGVYASLQRKLAGGNVYVTKVATTEEDGGDALIAPAGLGDVAAVEMDGRSQYCVNRGNFLACTPHVWLGIQYGNSWVNPTLGVAALTATGRGTLVITSYGGIFRLELSEGESYVVSKRHLVAWQGSMNPSEVEKKVVVDKSILDKIKTFFKRRLTAWLPWFSSSKNTNMCVLTGPGDFYLSSRLEPDFELSRNVARKVKQYIRQPAPPTVIDGETGSTMVNVNTRGMTAQTPKTLTTPTSTPTTTPTTTSKTKTTTSGGVTIKSTPPSNKNTSTSTQPSSEGSTPTPTPTSTSTPQVPSSSARTVKAPKMGVNTLHRGPSSLPQGVVAPKTLNDGAKPKSNDKQEQFNNFNKTSNN